MGGGEGFTSVNGFHNICELSNGFHNICEPSNGFPNMFSRIYKNIWKSTDLSYGKALIMKSLFAFTC